MKNNNLLYRFKTCMLGSRGVGKTAMVRRYVRDPVPDSWLTTIGTKIVMRNERDIDLSDPLCMGVYGQKKADTTLFIWDINHEVCRDALMELFFKGARSALFVVDSTHKEALKTIDQNIKLFYNSIGPTPMVFAAAKYDTWSLIRDRLAGRKIDGEALEEMVQNSLHNLKMEEAWTEAQVDYINEILEEIDPHNPSRIDPGSVLYNEDLEEISKLGDVDKTGYSAPQFFTSAFTGQNIEDAFRTIAKEMLMGTRAANPS